MSQARPLVTVPPEASAEEVAAITAAVTILFEERRRSAAAVGSGPGGRPDQLDAWVSAARLSGRRAGLTRGPWRLAGRIGRRHRA